MNHDKVLTLVAKLLAVREERGATEAEQASAAEHVQRLLQEHNLTLSQVEAAGSAMTSDRHKRTTGRRAAHAYQRDLMARLAENNFCLHRMTAAFPADGVVTVLVANPKKPGSEAHTRFGLYRPGMTVRQALGAGVLTVDLSWDAEHGFIGISGGSGPNLVKTEQHQLVGRDLNIRVTLQTYDYLTTAIHRASGEFTGPKRTLFCEGAVSRLCERLRELRRSAEAAMPRGNGTGRELVLSDVYGTEADLNNDFLNGFPQGTTATKRRETEARHATQQAEHDRLVSDGVPNVEAWYRAYGYGEAESHRLAKRYSRRGERGRSQSWTRADGDHHRRVNSPAYRAGREAGGSIGLDGQVGNESLRRIS